MKGVILVKKKFDLSIWKVASVAVGLIGWLISEQLDRNNEAKYKEDIKKEVLEELSKEK